MKIIHFKQRTGWSCGVASMKMVFDTLKIKNTRAGLVRDLEANKHIGTHTKAFPILAEKHKLDYMVGRNSSIADLEHALELGYLIILAYCPFKDNDYGHIAVVKKITKKRIYFYDPHFGDKHSYSVNYFPHIWHAYNGKEWGWFIGIKK